MPVLCYGIFCQWQCAPKHTYACVDVCLSLTLCVCLCLQLSAKLRHICTSVCADVFKAKQLTCGVKWIQIITPRHTHPRVRSGVSLICKMQRVFRKYNLETELGVAAKATITPHTVCVVQHCSKHDTHQHRRQSVSITKRPHIQTYAERLAFFLSLALCLSGHFYPWLCVGVCLAVLVCLCVSVWQCI